MTKISIEINPPNSEEQYLISLNQCFGEWGNSNNYDWVFNRSAGSIAPDRLILRDQGTPIAGSGISYRLITTAGGKKTTAGIMTGSWTLPPARGKGCFSKIIVESSKIVSSRGGSVLLAFVTEDNASFRRLEKAGSAIFQTTYAFSTDKTPAPSGKTANIEEFDSTDYPRNLLLRAYQGHSRQKSNYLRFSYPSFDAWKGQFINRPNPVKVLVLSNGAIAIIELANETMRILSLQTTTKADRGDSLKSILRWASYNKYRLFLFATKPGEAEVVTDLNMTIKRGFITGLVANWKTLSRDLMLPSPSDSIGDQLTSHSLQKQASSFFLGVPALESGDRM